MILARCFALTALWILPGCAGRGFGGDPSSVRVTLEAVSLDGKSLEGATALVDGQPAGTTPAELRLAPGSHTIAVSLGDATATETVTVGTRPARIKLAPRSASAEAKLERSFVADRMNQDRPLIGQCYRLQLARDGRARGRVDFSFQVLPDGSVGWAFTKYSELVDAETEECMAARVRRLTFDKPAGGEPALGEFTFVFSRDHRPSR